jgi:hypothetical protein
MFIIYSAPIPQMPYTYNWAPEPLYEGPVCDETQMPHQQEQQKTNDVMGSLWNVAVDFAENLLAQMVLD